MTARRRGATPVRQEVASRERRSRDHVRINLALWQAQSARYDRRHRKALGGSGSMAWGLWRIPESELRLLGDPRGRDVLEIGCGAARWSIALARRGARVVGLDLSSAQLARAALLSQESGERLRLVRGDAEQLPFPASIFDLAFCDWGAMTFCDPHRTVPEVARVLRPGGRLVFATSSPLRTITQNRRTDRIHRRLLYDYFGMRRVDYPGEVNFQLPYGEWIRLFGENGLRVESLTETRPPTGRRSTYLTPTEARWARRWPLESIWQVRKWASDPGRAPARKGRPRSTPGGGRRTTRNV